MVGALFVNAVKPIAKNGISHVTWSPTFVSSTEPDELNCGVPPVTAHCAALAAVGSLQTISAKPAVVLVKRVSQWVPYTDNCPVVEPVSMAFLMTAFSAATTEVSAVSPETFSTSTLVSELTKPYGPERVLLRNMRLMAIPSLLPPPLTPRPVTDASMTSGLV